MLYRKVYLSGPIASLSFDAANSWTDYAKNQLEHTHHPFVRLLGFRPLRNKNFLKDKVSLSAFSEGSDCSPLITDKAIVGRDRSDVMNSDCLLVNVLGAKIASIGTVSEIAWAYMLQKPIVLVMEKKGNVHHHSFILEQITHTTDDLEEALNIVRSILLP